MKKIHCVVLPLLLAAACGDSGSAKTDAPPSDTPPEGSTLDAAVPDVPAKVDASMESDVPVAQNDAPLVADGPSPLLDEAPLDTAALDTAAIDTTAADTGQIDAQTVILPDGTVATVVDHCSSKGDDGIGGFCSVTYAEGLANVLATPDAALHSFTAAGRCPDGYYVYVPYGGASSKYCYYDPSGQYRVSAVYYSDVLIRCYVDTVSYTLEIGGMGPPACPSVTWEAYR